MIENGARLPCPCPDDPLITHAYACTYTPSLLNLIVEEEGSSHTQEIGDDPGSGFPWYVVMSCCCLSGDVEGLAFTVEVTWVLVAMYGPLAGYPGPLYWLWLWML